MKRACLYMLCAVAACGPPPAVLDAGEDAGPEDAGTGDGGDDAGANDSGMEPDSGRPDSGTADGGADGGRSDAGMTDAGPTDGGADAGAMDSGTLVTVSHQRELRALWVGTVFNLDLPLAAARDPDAGTNELRNIVNLSANLGFNALVFQVRPESDAWYASPREPWSRFTSGTQGTSPGWDPLATLVSLAHARGLEVHAWMNPFRGLTSTTVVAAPGHITRVLPQHAITYNGAVVMDPSADAVRAWVAAVAGDIAGGYDVDGIHFDDYLYPYPAATPFPDDPQYFAYTADGGTLTKNDWRRSNINDLMRRTSQTVTALKPWVRFGVSPFGIYRPGTPAGITGFDAYNGIACDPLAWMSNGWVDYVAPQLYWTTNMSGQQFGLLIDWWAQQGQLYGRNIFAGHALYKLLSTPDWTTLELQNQVQLTRAEYPAGSGSIWFRMQMLRDDLGGMQAVFGTNLYAQPALPPPVATQRAAVVAPPAVSRAASTLTLSHAAPSTLRGYTLYRFTGGAFVLDRFVPGATAAVTVASGTWAVAAVNRADVESPGVVAAVP